MLKVINRWRPAALGLLQFRRAPQAICSALVTSRHYHDETLSSPQLQKAALAEDSFGRPSIPVPLKKPNFEFGDVQLKRKMVPVDANPAGNVHGGTILELAEQAGYVAASRHMFQYSRGSLQGGTPALIRMGHFDFLSPAFIGDLLFVQAKVVFASRRTMQVLLHVWSETTAGELRLTDRAYAWYVAVRNDMRELALVPPVEPQTETEHELWEYGKLSYQKLKARSRRSPFLEDVPVQQVECATGESGDGTTVCKPDGATLYMVPSETSVSLKSLILPGDCHHGTIAGAGVVMKMIDNAAGIVAFRHCRSNIVTAALDCMTAAYFYYAGKPSHSFGYLGACHRFGIFRFCLHNSLIHIHDSALDFDSPIRNGNLVHVDAQAVFASQKSLEVMVKVTVEDMIRNIAFQSNQALLTFVSLGEDKRTRKIPGLKLTGSREIELYSEGLRRYEQRKANNKKFKVGL